ncbi:MAG: cation:proton antiporter [Candidatus Woesearchaeota archaeon]
MASIFIEISLIIFLAVIVSAVMNYLKQPLLIGYIITGILVSPYLLNLTTSSGILEIFAEIGIALLLFMVGIHLNPKIIKDVGKISLITGLGQVIFTSLIGFLFLIALSFTFVQSIYIAIALTFSSTIIIIKLLSDKGDMDSLYGKIAMGFLIVQDIVAMILLMVISASSQTGSLSSIIMETLFLGTGIILLFLLFGYYLLPDYLNKIAKNQEYLLLFSIAWCLLAASLFYYLNFSIEVGALLAGITLAMSPYRHEISSVLKPLRDFFIFIFFIYLGSSMVFSSISNYILPIIFLSLFILIGNVLIVLILMTRMGYSSRTGFLAGLTVAQISEFSLILVALGVRVGHLTVEILSFVTIIGLITIAGSTYMILYSHKILPVIHPFIKKFEKKNLKDQNYEDKKSFKIVLFGANRMGQILLNSIKNKSNILIVDFDPNKILDLKQKGYNALYGDITDIELIKALDFSKTKIIISTVPGYENNSLLKNYAQNKNLEVIVTATNKNEALHLYEEGFDYVILPHYVAGIKIAKLLKENKLNAKNIKKFKEKQLEVLDWSGN